MARYVIGTDMGTTGTKSCIMDEEGKVLAYHYIEYKLYTPRASYAFHHPEDYWNAVADTIQSVIEQSKVNPEDIKGVCISAFSPGCILIDKEGNPLQDCHIWMDRRGVPQSDWLKENIGAEKIYQVSGNPIDSYYGFVKLMWEKENNQEVYKKAYKYLNAVDYPILKMTGQVVTDYSNAALFGIAYDIRKKTYDEEILAKTGIDPELLPKAYACDEIIGEVTKEAAARTGLKAGTPVLAGGVDATMAALANGALDDGDWSLTMGTAGCMGVIHNNSDFAKNLIEIPASANSGKSYASFAATIAFGSCLRYYRDEFAKYEAKQAKDLGVSVYDILTLEAGTVPAGSEGLIIVPYFSGERTPIWDPNARGIAYGWSLNHTKYHLLRALMEGAALSLYDNYMFMKEAKIKMNAPLKVGEGGAKSVLWRQIVSDVFGVEVAYQEQQKGAPEGDAICAGVATGVFPSYNVAKEWANFTAFNEPNMKNHEMYMEMYEIYKNVVAGTKDQFKVHADMTAKMAK